MISTAARGASTPTSSAASTGWPVTSASARTTADGQQWKLYYLYGLERAGRLARHPVLRPARLVPRGGRAAGARAEPALRAAGRVSAVEEDQVGRHQLRALVPGQGPRPVLVNKLRHGPGDDWNNDPDDVRNLVAVVSRDWKNLLTWQVVDPAVASVSDLLQAPIVFLNGHQAPEFERPGQAEPPRLRRAGRLPLRRRLLPQPGVRRRLQDADEGALPRGGVQAQAPLRRPPRLAGQAPADPGRLSALGHRARLPHRGDLFAQGPLLLLEPGRTRARTTHAVILATRVGQNVVDYATGKELPADKLVIREVRDFREDPAEAQAPCGSPSSSMPATGTSPRWPCPT